ncbi:MAG: ABC transporter permease, partial [Candidatus Limnocylindrales bacterium]
MLLSRGLRIALRIASAATLAFIYIPIGVIVLYSFNAARVATWPISGLTLDWYGRALGNAGIRNALITSVEAALGATFVALVLGGLIAFAVQRHAFFGRQTLSFVVVLPLALPGIVTGLALNAAFRTLGWDFGLVTIIVGHATFCVVIVFNNVVARLRRTARTAEEASMDLGADTFTTFRRITFPAIRSALLAGA